MNAKAYYFQEQENQWISKLNVSSIQHLLTLIMHNLFSDINDLKRSL